MTLEQLLSPAVIEYCGMTAERDELLSREERIDEFKKWAIENEDLINESVKNNLDKINECIERSIAKQNLLIEEVEAESPSLESKEGDMKPKKFGSAASLFGKGKGVNITGKKKMDDPSTITGSEIENDSPKDDTVDITKPDKSKKSISFNTTILHNSNPTSPNYVFNAINSAYDNMVSYDKEHGTEYRLKKMTPYWDQFDVSEVTDMTALFAFTDLPNADLGSWDVRKVESMDGMFYKSTFNSPSIIKWHPNSCGEFSRMFKYSSFSQDLSVWEKEKRTKPNKDPKTDASGKVIPGEYETTYPMPVLNGAEEGYLNRVKKHWSEENKKSLDLFKDLDDVDENKTIKTNKDMKHILDYDTFINEGYIKDTIKKGINKVKSFFKNIVLKLNDIIVFFDKNGEVLEATSPYTSFNLISKRKVEGVNAFSKVKNDLTNNDVKSVAHITEKKDEFYDYIGTDSIEYRNIKTLVKEIKENYSEYGDLDMLNEGKFETAHDGRVGLSAEEGGLKEVGDINTFGLKLLIEEALERTPGDIGDSRNSKAMLIWGAPGVGKSTIPKTIIDTWNKTHNEKKGLIVVECGDLTIDGFSIPMPATKSLGQLYKSNPEVFKRMKENGSNYDDPEFKEYLETKVMGSFDAIKDWLPFYKVSDNEETNRNLNAVANGAKELKYNEHIKLETEHTTDGGIILFDEFFRANENIFKVLMQILLNRKISGGYVLGDKWTIVACSNRPYDDPEVGTSFETTGAVVGTRFGGGQFNFIPDFKDWAKWAYNFGGFDYPTLSFLMSDVDENKQYTNWHTINPAGYKDGQTVWGVPRSWTDGMNNVVTTLEKYGFGTITECLKSKKQDEKTKKAQYLIKEYITGTVGKTLANKYFEYIMNFDKGAIFDPEKIFIPDFKIEIGNPIPENEDVEDVDIPKLTPTEIAVNTAKYISLNLKNDITDDKLAIMIDNINNNFNRLNSTVKSLFPFILDKLGFTEKAQIVYDNSEKIDELIKLLSNEEDDNEIERLSEELGEYINPIAEFCDEYYPEFVEKIIKLFNLNGESQGETLINLSYYQIDSVKKYKNGAWRAFV